MWYWLTHEKAIKFLSEETCDEIENEYQAELAGKRVGQKVFHCFGTCSATINYQSMKTSCSSGIK